MYKRSDIKGFTLIEVMIVVAIIGLLAAIAIPSYTQYVVRVNRSDAQVKLTQVMFEQERYQARKRTYATNLTTIGFSANPVISDEGLYSIGAAACAGGIAITDCVQLTATPVTGRTQANNGEAALTLNSQGVKGGKWRR